MRIATGIKCAFSPRPTEKYRCILGASPPRIHRTHFPSPASKPRKSADVFTLASNWSKSRPRFDNSSVKWPKDGGDGRARVCGAAARVGLFVCQRTMPVVLVCLGRRSASIAPLLHTKLIFCANMNLADSAVLEIEGKSISQSSAVDYLRPSLADRGSSGIWQGRNGWDAAPRENNREKKVEKLTGKQTLAKTIRKEANDDRNGCPNQLKHVVHALASPSAWLGKRKSGERRSGRPVPHTMFRVADGYFVNVFDAIFFARFDSPPLTSPASPSRHSRVTRTIHNEIPIRSLLNSSCENISDNEPTRVAEGMQKFTTKI